MSEGSSRAPARLQVGFLVLIGALAAMGPFSIDLYLPAFGAIGTDLGVGADRVQGTLSAYFVGLALGQLVMGPLSDRYGRRGPLLAGLLLYFVASVGSAFAGTIVSLTAWRGLQALGACAGTVASRAVLRDRYEARDMARALSLVMLVMGLAPVLAPLAGALLHEWLGWRALFLFLAVYGAGVLAAVAWGLPETLQVRSQAPPRQVVRDYASLLVPGPFLRYAIVGGFAQAGMFVYIGSSSFVFTEVVGLSTTAYAVVFGLNAAGLVGGAQLNARWLRGTTPEATLPKVLWLQGAASLALVGVAASSWGASPMLAVPLFVCVASLGFLLPNTTALAMEPVGDRAGLAAALLGTIQYGLAGLATLIAGQLYDGTALPMAVAMAGCSLVAGIVLALPTPQALEERWRA